MQWSGIYRLFKTYPKFAEKSTYLHIRISSVKNTIVRYTVWHDQMYSSFAVHVI